MKHLYYFFLLLFSVCTIHVKAQTENNSYAECGIDYQGAPWVQNVSIPFKPTKGLATRHIFLWPSHGRYYNPSQNIWKWQRPYIYCTTEDLLTQSFVNPFLIPMLENAGAYVFSARERDTQTEEIIVDNDTPQQNGTYTEEASLPFFWRSTPDSTAFSIPQEYINDSSLIWNSGTARTVASNADTSFTAQVTYTPNVSKSGQYAVYVSYPEIQNAIPDAHYTVHHAGGATNFLVNQRMGAGTWVYLGTFLFHANDSINARVCLTNQSEYRGRIGTDAIRLGGGMAHTMRGDTISSMPRFLEGARYHAQWCGLPTNRFNTEHGKDDYKDDIRARSNLLNWLGGGSAYMPDTIGRRVPFEVAVALHTDAGIWTNGITYGTLSIATTHDSEGRSIYNSGLSRESSLSYGKCIMDNIQRDLIPFMRTISRKHNAELDSFLVTHIESTLIRDTLDPGVDTTYFQRDTLTIYEKQKPWPDYWTRREEWDKNYGETRSPNVPSVIIEMLSHQNFRDMQCAHDPNFKFVMSRAIYKGILRYIYNTHNLGEPIIQPLPIQEFCAQLEEQQAVLSWVPTIDTIEPTALPTGYIVYSRTEDDDWDNGTYIECSNNEQRFYYKVNVTPGKIHSYRVVAVNDGGASFPSEELCIYLSANPSAPKGTLINAFTRLSGPAYIETSDSLGFLLNKDAGVAYRNTGIYAGEQLCFDKKSTIEEGRESLGYCHYDQCLASQPGNNFDLPFKKLKELIQQDRTTSYYSSSVAALPYLLNNNQETTKIYYLAGLQRRAPWNHFDYPVWPISARPFIEYCITHDIPIEVEGVYTAPSFLSQEERYWLFQHPEIKRAVYRE